MIEANLVAKPTKQAGALARHASRLTFIGINWLTLELDFECACVRVALASGIQACDE